MVADKPTPDWIPNLCIAEGLLRVVLFSLLISCLLALLRYGFAGFSAITFGPLALFVLWLNLLSAYWFCFLRRWQTKVGNWVLNGAALLGVVALTGISSWAFNLLIASSGQENVTPFASVTENLVIAFLVAVAILRFLVVYAQMQRHESQLNQARFDALQARIRPHFLFNTLNSITALISSRPSDAEEAVLNLSDMLRSSLGVAQQNWSLEDEISICEKYLEIEKLRMGERLDWDIQVTGQLPNIRFPQLALQPLVENAVLHGIQGRESGGRLNLDIHCENSKLTIRLSNPLAERTGRAGSGQALENIRARLISYFNSVDCFDAAVDDNQFVVKIQVTL